MPKGIPKNGVNNGWIKKGQKLPEKTCEKMGKSRVGNKWGFKEGHTPWNRGKTHTEETRKKLKESHLGQVPWNKGKRGVQIAWNKGLKGFMAGEKSSSWKGGIGKLPYSQDWTDIFREGIRKRDDYVCQECGIHQDELSGFLKKLDIHHIDYDKENLDPENLISLCRSCHTKTNNNREYWTKYFQNK
jgi:hypothetical protein